MLVLGWVIRPREVKRLNATLDLSHFCTEYLQQLCLRSINYLLACATSSRNLGKILLANQSCVSFAISTVLDPRALQSSMKSGCIIRLCRQQTALPLKVARIRNLVERNQVTDDEDRMSSNCMSSN